MAPVAGGIAYGEEDGLVSRLAFSNASSHQGYQSTGLYACCSR